MSEPLEFMGRWWLPEHDQHKVHGTLKWDPVTGGTLQLHDELRPVIWKDNVVSDGTVQKYRNHPTRSEKQYPVILGQVAGRARTLLNSFQLSVREYDTGDSIERVHVNEVLDGAWFTSPDDLQADRVVVHLRHLTTWVDQSGLKVVYPGLEDPTTDQYAHITSTLLPALPTNNHDGTVRFLHRPNSTGDHVHEVGVIEKWRLLIAYPDPRPVSTFIETASDIQDLLSIAAGETADFEKVVIQHPALPALSLAGTPIGEWRDDITYHRRWANRSQESDPLSRHDMYFTLDSVGGIDGVGRWLAVSETYRTELGRVMATRYSNTMYLEDRIANVAAALDSFDKVRRNTDPYVDYVKRIEACIALAGQPFRDLIVKDPNEWAKTVKETRHDLAHHRERFRLSGSVGEHLLAEQLFWLFAMCMLRLAQAPGAFFDSLGKHSQIRWLIERATDTTREPNADPGTLG